MKKLNILFTGLALFGAILFGSCSSGSDSADEASDTTIVQLEEKMDNLESGSSDSLNSGDATKNLGKEYTAKYVCPMHCKGSGSDKAGDCSECGMEMIENPSHNKK